ncbi:MULTISPECIES: hypothetical protein [unclassified Novosphingobium]|uniref:hypothetical protein n=1 Tax=unclassified Novosphingobium TaxID=2644732 RepID=UPI000ED5F5B8|nr:MULTISPECIES: hypothetical protein [unclassified Novosphingobium]HCF24511.1 hypothetical protein [Novosphingobium sp.]HQV03324.1 hypothetical protein [Novosphingobium sp.]
MDTNSTGKASATFWIISAFSLLWNGFGGYDYLMTRMRNIDYVTSATGGSRELAEEMLALVEGMPFFAQILWPLGVWSSVLGSLLLLARSRHAARVFALSLIAAAASFAFQMTVTMPAELDTPAMKVMPLVILGAIVLQWWFARRKTADGTLR